MKETMELIGTILKEDVGKDAIHIAVAPVVAAARLLPGQEIGFIDAETGLVGVVSNPIGIVDPFIKDVVLRDERFFIFLYPRTITSLRHEWEHPAFKVDSSPAPITKSLEQHKVDSEKWLNELAHRIYIPYGQLMNAAETWLADKDYTVQQGSETWRDDFGDPKEFWHHYEIVTGTKVEDHEATFFCCNC